MNNDRYSDDNKVHDVQRLKELQALPLERKVLITQSRILEWYNYWNGQVYVSFSGGKDSTVLLHIVRNLFPNVEAVFVDTGLEYPELRAFVKTFDNVTCLKPKMNFRQVIDTYGYPLVSKEVAKVIYDARSAIRKGNSNSYAIKQLEGKCINPNTGEKSLYNKSKYKFLLDAPFLISHRCCDVMKKQTVHLYEKKSGNKPIIATMASESRIRRTQWVANGCNAFTGTNPSSKPISFWTENDILEYITKNDLQIAPVYGEVVKTNEGGYTTTGEKRTGCMFCGFGCHLEKSPNRFERMKSTHPQIWDYCIRPKDQGGLGMGEVLDFIHVPYGKEEH